MCVRSKTYSEMLSCISLNLLHLLGYQHYGILFALTSKVAQVDTAHKNQRLNFIFYSKGKVHPITGYEGPKGVSRYNSALSLTSALDGVGGQSHASASLPPGKTRYPLYTRVGGPQGRSGLVRKISPPPEFDPRAV